MPKHKYPTVTQHSYDVIKESTFETTEHMKALSKAIDDDFKVNTDYFTSDTLTQTATQASKQETLTNDKLNKLIADLGTRYHRDVMREFKYTPKSWKQYPEYPKYRDYPKSIKITNVGIDPSGFSKEVLAFCHDFIKEILLFVEDNFDLLKKTTFITYNFSWSTDRGASYNPYCTTISIDPSRWLLYQRVNGIYNFSEYKYFYEDEIIGSLRADNWKTIVKALICHEVSHFIQYHTKGNDYTLSTWETPKEEHAKKGHNEFFREPYRILRKEFVNQHAFDIGKTGAHV